MNKILVIKNIHKTFKQVKAVQGVDLEINQGEFVALLGPNGAGKTTLVEIIEGIQKHDVGEVWINNLLRDNNQHEIQKFLGVSLQETHFFGKLTVKETLNLFASFYNLHKERCDEILKLIDLESKADAYTMHLSGGQRQRLALGVALLHSPKILLLDEPSTGLDPNARRELWNILLNLKKQINTSMLLTTHYMEEAEYLCDRVVMMDKGKILAQGTVNELLNTYNCKDTIKFSLENTAQNIPDFEGMKILWNDNLNGGSIEINTTKTSIPKVLDYFRDYQLNFKTIKCHHATLDDLFISMTGRHLEE